MRLSPLSLAAFVAPFALGLLTGCGGSTASVPPSPDASSGGNVDGGGSSPDGGGTSGEGGPLADSGGGADGADSSAEADSGPLDAGACNEMATRKDCVACCDVRYATGLTAFDTAVEECACGASLCGPLDDGGVPGDSGDLGIERLHGDVRVGEARDRALREVRARLARHRR